MSNGPSLLSYTRATYSAAKRLKKRYWRGEAAASAAAVLAVALPWPEAGPPLIALGLLAKLWAKSVASEAKSLFRRAERGRRYDFEQRTLGWPIPPTERADMYLASPDIEAAARGLAVREPGYYASEGPPSTTRFLSNLMESIFWSEKLMALMGKRRWKQSWIAAGALVGTLVIAFIVQPGEAAPLIIRVLASAVSLFVALDVYGEARSFQRGERELCLLLSALSSERKKKEPNADEAMRVWIEYNCLLSELPMIPDEVYRNATKKLNEAWTAFEAEFPTIKPA